MQLALPDCFAEIACVAGGNGIVCQEWRHHVHEITPDFSIIVSMPDASIGEVRHDIQQGVDLGVCCIRLSLINLAQEQSKWTE